MSAEVRLLQAGDADWMDAGFNEMGWAKPAGYFHSVVDAHVAGFISAWVASVGDDYAGHVKLVWPDRGGRTPPSSWPEVEDLAVISRMRRRGIASYLLDSAEAAAFGRYDIVRIGVGLHPGYRAAQRLYVLRGYVPDARGVTHNGRLVEEGETVPFDDDLVLHLEKRRPTSPGTA